MIRIDGFGDFGLQRPQQSVPPRAGGDLGQRRSPGAAADHRQPLDCHAFTPAPRTFSAASSSGQRARAGASSPSMRPAAKRSAPAQPIIAALSVHSQSGGTLKARPLALGQLGKRRPHRPVGGDPAGDDQSRGHRPMLECQRRAIDHAIDHCLLEAGGDVRGLSLARCDGALDRALQAGEGEMRLAAADQRARQRHGAGIAVAAPAPRSPGRRDRAGRAAWRPCRTPRRRHRRWSSPAAGSRRRRAPRATGNGRRWRAAADRESRGRDRPAAG